MGNLSVTRSICIILFALAFLCLIGQRLRAQGVQPVHPVKITIEVLNGRNGKPLIDQRVLVFTADSKEGVKGHAQHVETVTDKSGVGELVLDSADAQWLQVFVDQHVLCYSSPNQIGFSVREITSKGLVTPNSCGSFKRDAIPGHVIVFARKPTFFEKMKR